jgi:hypothetical protein
VGRATLVGAVGPPRGEGGGGLDVCMRVTFIFNEIWAKDKNTYFPRHFSWLKCFTYYHFVPVTI